MSPLRCRVAPRKGRVSRNAICAALFKCYDVAPRKGRVSRNSSPIDGILSIHVAPRKGRVSRNDCEARAMAKLPKSRPARGV